MLPPEPLGELTLPLVLPLLLGGLWLLTTLSTLVLVTNPGSPDESSSMPTLLFYYL